MGKSLLMIDFVFSQITRKVKLFDIILNENVGSSNVFQCYSQKIYY